jgi:SNF2 family DNA or RNA helicase
MNINDELKKLIEEFRENLTKEIRAEIMQELKDKEEHKKYCHPDCPEQDK